MSVVEVVNSNSSKIAPVVTYNNTQSFENILFTTDESIESQRKAFNISYQNLLAEFGIAIHIPVLVMPYSNQDEIIVYVEFYSSFLPKSDQETLATIKSELSKCFNCEKINLTYLKISENINLSDISFWRGLKIKYPNIQSIDIIDDIFQIEIKDKKNKTNINNAIKEFYQSKYLSSNFINIKVLENKDHKVSKFPKVIGKIFKNNKDVGIETTFLVDNQVFISVGNPLEIQKKILAKQTYLESQMSNYNFSVQSTSLYSDLLRGIVSRFEDVFSIRAEKINNDKLRVRLLVYGDKKLKAKNPNMFRNPEYCKVDFIELTGRDLQTIFDTLPLDCDVATVKFNAKAVYIKSNTEISTSLIPKSRQLR